MQINRFDYIINACRGKRVLHIGCSDDGLTRERFASGQLLHQRLDQVARVRGIDITGLDLLREYGFSDLLCLDICREIPQGSYDVVVVPEVLEHLSNPGLALDNIAQIDAGEIIFSVPAARFRFSEHPDHNFYFTEKSIKTLLRKHGFEIVDFQKYHFKRLQPWEDGYLITTIL